MCFLCCAVFCAVVHQRRGRKRSNWTLSKGQQQQLSGKGKPLKLMMEKQEQDTVIIRTKKRKIIEEERIRRFWTNSPQVIFCLKNYLEELHQQHTGQTKVCRVSNYKEEPTTSWQDCCQACQAGRQHGRFPMATNLITDLTDFKDCKEIPRNSWHKLQVAGNQQRGFPVVTWKKAVRVSGTSLMPPLLAIKYFQKIKCEP